MSCVNPNSPEFKNILKKEPNFLLAEILYDKAIKEIEKLTSNEEQVTSPIGEKKLSFLDSTDNWDFKPSGIKMIIDDSLLNTLLADEKYTKITDPIQIERFKQLSQIIGERETYRAYFENRNQVPPSDYFFEQQEKEYAERPKGFPVYDKDVESLDKPMPSIESIIDSFEELIEQENNATALTIAEKISQQLGVPYEIISREEFDAKFPGQLLAKHYYSAGKVYLVAGNITPSDVFHEFSHPIIKAIALQNPDLFEKLFKSLASTSLGMSIMDMLSEDPNLEYGSQAFMEETMVTALEILNKEPSRAPQSFLKELFFQIKQFLRKVFGKKIDVSKLNSKTTLEDLVKMINAGESFVLDINLLEKDMMVLFKKDYEAIAKSIETKTQEKTLELFNQAYNLVEQQLEQFKAEEDIYVSIQDNLYSEDNSGMYNKMVYALRELATQSKGRRINEGLDLSIPENAANFATKIQKFASIIGEADVIFEEFAKKLNYLNQLTQYNDENFNQLLAIGNYVDQWKIAVDSWYNDHPSIKIEDDPFKLMLANFSGQLADLQRTYKTIMVNATIDVLYNHLEAVLKPVQEDMKKQMQILLNDGKINAYDKLHKQYYGLTIAEKDELNTLKNKSNKTVDDDNRIQVLTLMSYDSYNLSKEALLERMKGNLPDAGFWNGQMESYNLNQDIVVGGFFNYLEQNFSEVNANANAMRARLLKNLQPLMEAAGYDNYYTGEGKMGKDLSQENKSYTYNNGQLEEFMEYKFKNNFIDYEFTLQKLRDDVKKARQNYNKERPGLSLFQFQAEKEAALIAYEDALEKLDDFEFNYMTQDYVKEYYEIKRKYFKSPLGKKALKAQEKIFEKINLVKEHLELNPTEKTYSDELRSYELELKQLYNKYDLLTGDKKTGDELAIAELFENYNKEIQEYHEFEEKPNAFELAYALFVANMADKNIFPSDPQFIEAEKKWLERNTTISVTDDYYEKRTALIERKKILLEKLKKINQDIYDDTEVLEKIYGILKMTIDPYNQYDGNVLSPNVQKEITQLEEEMLNSKDFLFTMYGFTINDLKKYQYLTTLFYDDLDVDDQLFIDDFQIYAEVYKKIAAIDKTVIEEVLKINEELAEMSQRGLTNHYLDIYLEFYKKSPDFKLVLDDLVMDYFGYDLNGGDELTTDILDDLLKSKDSFGIINALKSIDPSFTTWFENNHFVKEYREVDEDGKYTDNTYNAYSPSATWRFAMPNELKYYNTKSVIGLGISSEHASNGYISLNGIPRIPSRQYQNKKVKAEYDTVELHKEKLRQNGIDEDAIDRYHKDYNDDLIVPIKNNKKEFLPIDQEYDPLSPTEYNPYIDRSYKEMFYSDPNKWELLNYLSNVHLDNQKGLDKYQKLGLSYPRERMGSVEQYSKGYLQRKINNVIDTFYTAADDYDLGANVVGNTDFSYKTMIKPITGSFAIPIVNVSTNIVNSLENHAYSIAQFKTLRDKNSFANVFEKVIADLSANPEVKIVNGMVETIQLLSPNNSKESNRAKQIKTIIDKNFRGKQIAGLFPTGKTDDNLSNTNRTIAKIITALSKSMAFKTFMLDPIKSIRNYLGGKIMLAAKSGEGLSYGPGDLIATRLKSGKAISEIIGSLYSKKQPSALLQLLDLMDAVPNNLKKDIGTRGSRTVQQSVFEGKIFVSERRFLSDSVPIHQLLAMLNKSAFMLNGVKTTLDEAVELDNEGRVVTVSGVPAEFVIEYDAKGKAIIGSKIKEIMSEHQSLLQKSLGITNEYNEPEMYRSLFGKALFFLMKFFPGMSSDRYQFRTKKGKIGQSRLNLARRKNELGTYIAIVKLASELIDNKGQFYKFNNYSWQAKKGVLQLMLAFVISKIISLITANIGFDTDDDEVLDYFYNPNDKNLISNLKGTTSIPDTPLTSKRRTIEGSNVLFRPKNYLKMHLLRLALEVQTETDTFFPNYFVKTGMGVLKLDAPLTSGGMMQFIDITIDALNDLAGEQSNRYEQHAGPLSIQDKGRNKWVAGVAGTFGITGSFIDPAFAIQNRQRFVNDELPWFTYYKENY